MIPESSASKSILTDPTLWTPGGVAAGSLVGSFFHDTIFGMLVGLMVGSVVTMIIERKRKKTWSRLMIGVGVLAVVVVLITRVIERL